MRQYLLALDIGSTTAKFVQILKVNQQQQFRIAKSGVIPVPPDTVVDGEILDLDSAATAIKTALQNKRISTRQTAVAVNSARLILRRLDLPPLPLSQLKQLLAWELERYTPYSAQETNFALLSLELSTQYHTVLLAAIPKKVVNSLLITLKLAGLRPSIIEPKVVALFRWIQFCYPFEEDDIIILDLGTSSADILIVSHGQPVIARAVALNDNGSHSQEILLNEISRSLDFAQAHNHISPKPCCYCVGNQDSNSHLLRSLEDNLGELITTVENSPFPEIDSNLFATNLGLGLGWWGGETPCKQVGN